MKKVSYRQLLDKNLEKLNDDINWGEDRKRLIKKKIQDKVMSNHKRKGFLRDWEWLKVSFSLVFVGLICFVLIANIFDEKMEFFGFDNANSDNYSWHNLELKPVLPPIDRNWASFEDYPNSVQSFTNFDLVESQKLASFKIMRPNFDLNMPLEISRGVVNNPTSSPVDNFYYWDIWHKEDKWVWSRQFLSENSNQILSTKERKFIWQTRSNTELILNNKKAIGVLSNEGEDGFYLNMKVKNEKEQVIEFQIRGNIEEEELIKLAKSYLE